MITVLTLVTIGIVLLKIGGYLWTSDNQRVRGEEGAEGVDSTHTRTNMLTNIGSLLGLEAPLQTWRLVIQLLLTKLYWDI